MKNIINKTIHWFGLTLVVIILLLAVLLSFFRIFAANLQTSHYRQVEQFVSSTIDMPIGIERLTVGSRGLEPIIKLHNVTIFNKKKTKKLIKVKELQIGVDLIGSLLNWNIKPGVLVINGVNLTIYQDKSGKLSVFGITDVVNDNITNNDFAFNDLLERLFEQGKIKLRNLTLVFNFIDDKIFRFNKLNLSLDNGILQHNLKINGRFVQEHADAIFEARLKLHGNILKNEISSLTGNIAIEDWHTKLPDKIVLDNDFPLPACDINLFVKNSKIVSSIFRQPLLFNYLECGVVFRNSSNGLDLQIQKVKFQDNWLSAQGGLKFLFPNVNDGNTLPITDIQLEFSLVNLAKAKLYYPIAFLPSDATVWLNDAFIQSKPMSGVFVLQGPLTKFPFDNNEGKFLVKANLNEVVLNYDKNWPLIEDINGNIIFENRAMKIFVHSAKILKAKVESIKAIIPDLDLPILSVYGNINTDSKIGLKFLQLSPLKKTVASKLQGISLSGAMNLVLKLVMPISPHVPQKSTTVDGTINLNHNVLRPYNLDLVIDNLQGKLHFTENNISSSNLKGGMFGRPIDVSISTSPAPNNDTITYVNIFGSSGVKNIDQIFHNKLELSSYLVGDFKYNALIELHSITKENVFKLHSNLNGVAINLPDPFTKKAADAVKFHLFFYFGTDQPPCLIVNYNNQLDAILSLKKDSNNLWRINAGEIKFGKEYLSHSKILSKEEGVVVSGSMKKVDWSVWQNYLGGVQSGLASIGSVFKRIDLTISELFIFKSVLKQVTLSAQPKDNGWRVVLETPLMLGEIFFPFGDVNGQIRGIFQNFYFDKSHLGTENIKPQDLKPLSFIFNNFHYDNYNFDMLEFITEPKRNGLKINKISIKEPRFNLVATGDWGFVNNKSQSSLKGNAKSEDIGGLLKQFKLTDNLIGSQGWASFDLHWPGSPYKTTIKDINGIATISIYNGRIINFSKKTEATLSLGKVLNMLSLRNLSLNFGSMLKNGFSFSKMICDLELNNGNALIKNITLDGDIALVEARGRIGLITQDYDLNLKVTPRVTSSVPVAATVLGGPVVGLISFFAENAIIAPLLKKATTNNYHVTGSWDNPVLSKN